MFFKMLIGAIIFACALYYLVCFLEIFGVIKWTPKHISIRFPKMLIPFYYFSKKAK